MEINELAEIRTILAKMFGKDFVYQSDHDYSTLNKVVAENIDMKIPEEGEKILKLVNLAQERNISY